MLIKEPDDPKSSEITDESAYQNRRKFLKGVMLAGSVTATSLLYRQLTSSARRREASDSTTQSAPVDEPTGEQLTAYEDITNYNNFYEFSTNKQAVASKARNFVVDPWSVEVEGLVHKPRTFSMDDLLKIGQPEERIYRLRCVEGWSMVIPWLGIPLATLLKLVEPMSDARFVGFVTLADPNRMPNISTSILDWPYVEGLRLDEALHPLTILATGLYGKPLPPQDGAPVRLVVPWKYGFKSIKSIVKIRLVAEQPITTWSSYAPREYGFYSNVNPNVDHPRWSQATERRIGEFSRRKTLMFNGYGDQVSQFYNGMDLRVYY